MQASKSSSKIILLIIITFLGLVSCKSQPNKSLLEIDKSTVLEEHNLPLPKYVMSLNIQKIVEIDHKPYLYAYFFPLFSLYVYDIQKDTIAYKIPLKFGLRDFNVFNKDSILLLNNSDNNDSTLMVINSKGEIKKVFPLHYPNLISSQYPDSILIPQQNQIYVTSNMILADNKIFLAFYYYYYGLKGYQKHYPIIGYYDLKKDTLIVNNDIWYPELKEGKYFKEELYSPGIILNNKGNIIISFQYTPTFYEWDFKRNILKTHCVASQFVDTIKYSKSLFANYDDYRLEYNYTSFYCLFDYSTDHNLYHRGVVLEDKNKAKSLFLSIIIDSAYQYKGETFYEDNIHTGIIYKDLSYEVFIKNGRLKLIFFKNTYKPYNKNNIKKKIDDEYARQFEEKKKEVCTIVENYNINYQYQPNDIIKYLRKKHNIKDSSFVVTILNNSGCPPCNDYVLTFIQMNQATLFTMEKPLYVMYANENSTALEIEGIFNEYNITDRSHTICENSKIFKNFNPHPYNNPRLVLVRNNKVIFDEIYFPDKLDELALKILEYYGLEPTNKSSKE